MLISTIYLTLKYIHIIAICLFLGWPLVKAAEEYWGKSICNAFCIVVVVSAITTFTMRHTYNAALEAERTKATQEQLTNDRS